MSVGLRPFESVSVSWSPYFFISVHSAFLSVRQVSFVFLSGHPVVQLNAYT